MTEPTPTPAPSDAQFQDTLGRLATAIEERPPVEIEEVPATKSSRYLYWMIGAVCALTIGAAEVAILLRGNQLSVPAPPPEVIAALADDPCGPRMVKIMDAIAAYSAAHGGPPPTLDVLHPTYLDFAPIDPGSNQPYGYAVMGAAISLSCPSIGSPSDAAAPPAATR